MFATSGRVLKRQDDRIIIHFDYDCFYASVFEAENPSLKALPLAVQQKQIIVTCNYVARKRGLRKMQYVTDAKKTCPEVVIVLGEDLTRFRDASKALYKFLRGYSWNDKVERLGFDEVWMDVTDMVDYNLEILNSYDLPNSFFQLSKSDPTIGFSYNATTFSGHLYPPDSKFNLSDPLALRLILGSHVAAHVRHALEEQKRYTSTIGISTNKVLSKLVGNVHKPNSQTTLVPPYETHPDPNQAQSNVLDFLDPHDIGAVPYIGFKTAHSLRQLVLGGPPKPTTGLLYGSAAPPTDKVTVAAVRALPRLSPALLTQHLRGPGIPSTLGPRVFALLHGIDDTPVAPARTVPTQISIEDSYLRLDTLARVRTELLALSHRLIERMRADLLASDSDSDSDAARRATTAPRTPRWRARPQTLRLTTRARPPAQADGTRARSRQRSSRSTACPGFVCGLDERVEVLAERLVEGCLMGLFWRLHPVGESWDLSLVNVAVSEMVWGAGKGAGASGRDVGRMLRGQDDVLGEFRIRAEEKEEDKGVDKEAEDTGAVEEEDEGWDDSDEAMETTEYTCGRCGSSIPLFAQVAHERFHSST